MTKSSAYSIKDSDAHGEELQGPPVFFRSGSCFEPPPNGSLVATTAWVFTFPLIAVEVLILVMILAAYRLPYKVASLLPSLVYSGFVIINGTNLLRAQEGDAYISAGFTIFIGTLATAPLFVFIRALIEVFFEPGWVTEKIMLALLLLRVAIGVIVTPCALLAGYFWSAKAPKRSSTSTVSSAASSHPLTYSSCGPPKSPTPVVMAWYTTVVAMVAHAVLVVQPTFLYFRPIFIYYYGAYIYFPSISVIVTGAILLRSYRKATYRSAGFIYLAGCFVHLYALSTAGYAGGYLEGLRSIVPTVCLITLMVAAAAAFRSCSSLPSQHHPGNGQVLARGEPHTPVMGPSRRDIEPPV